MKYLEIIAPDIVPVMNKGITHHQALFTLFPSPRKKPPEHNILNAWWFLCWEMDGIFFVCLLYVMSTISASITACYMPRCGADVAAIATSFSCNMSMMIWRYVQEYANSSSLVGSILSNQKKCGKQSKRSTCINSPCHILSKHLHY